MRRQFNLSALADRFEAEKRHAPLVGLIRKARDLQSAHSDLKIANEALCALAADLNSPTDPNDHHRQVVQMALLHHAIVFYARATKTSSSLRRTYDITPKLNEQERAVHNEIIGLRDDAVAHYGIGKQYRGEWQVELLILDIEHSDDGETAPGRVAGLGRRLLIDHTLVVRMRGQVTRALEIFAGLFWAANAKVAAALKSPEIMNEVVRHPFNPVTFMGSETQAQAMLKSASDGAMLRGFIDPAQE